MRSTAVPAGFAPSVPPAAVERAVALERGGPVVVPRRSASVVLLRDGIDDRGLEVHLLHRHARMAFAPSVAAFPGGGVDPVDLSTDDPVLACALRETAEETTVQLAADALVAWARWVTPEHEPRRHDTTFFLAALPADAAARDVSGETERAGWTLVAEALAAREAGTLVLMPPTWSVLLELVAYDDVASALRAGQGRVVETVLPRLVRQDRGWAYAYETLA